MDYSQKLDRENCQKDANLVSALEEGGNRMIVSTEQIIVSSTVWKFSAVNKQQKRILLITNKNLYNLTPQSTFANIFSKVVSSLRVKRKIPHSLLHGVTVSKYGYEFILHVPEQYDYRYSSLDFRDKILETLADCYFRMYKRKLMFYFSDELNLSNFCTTKIDNKKGISRIPQSDPVLLDGREIKDYDFGKYVKGTSTIQVKKSINKNTIRLDDFKVHNLIGKGSLGQIFLCELQRNKSLYAMKVLMKQDVITTDHLTHVKAERKLLETFHHPNLMYLEFAFHDEERIYIILPFIQGGDLFFHLKKEKRFKEDRVRFYAAQLVMALQYIHDRDYVYRDLKPENLLLDRDGYLVLTDYGLAKPLGREQVTHSFVGSPDYLAPEIISAQGHNRMVDWWTLGILMYEMLIGITPFYSENQNQMFESIQDREPKFPNSLGLQNETKDVIVQLLKKDPRERLGFKKGAEEIKTHPFFASVNFKEIFERRVYMPISIRQAPSPFKPKILGSMDVNNFEVEVKHENSILTTQNSSDKSLLSKFEDEFFYINYDPINKRKNTAEESKHA